MISSYRVVFKHITTQFFFGAAVLGLVACGGGGGGGTSPTPAPDTRPNAFSFSAQNGVALGAVVESETVTIGGIDAAAPVSVSGGEYAIGSGAYGSTTGSIGNGQTVKVRATAATEFSTAQTVSLNIGGVTGSFAVTTLALDDEPEPFAPLSAQTGITRSTEFTFAEFTVTGINSDVPISITGGTYAVNGGEFVSTDGEVSLNDTVAVKVTASSEFSISVDASLSIGSGRGSFSVESEAEDTDPNAFELGDSTSTSVPGATAESHLVTIAGINSPANILIANGEYRIEGVQDYTTSASTVAAGQQVQVRVTAASQVNQTETATLTIGNQSDTFEITTADQSPPTAEVVFPTANTLSNGTTVTLRGKASDDFGPVTEINVRVTTDDGTVEVDNETLTATGDEDFRNTWSVQVDLASETLNTLQVTATDSAGNVQAAPLTLTVLQKADALVSLFPEDNDDVLIGPYTYFGIEWDRVGNRLLIPRRGPHQILAVDVDTGTRSVFIEEDPAFNSFSMLKLLPEQNALLFADQNNGIIFNANLDSGAFTVLTDDSSPNSNIDIVAPYSMELGDDGALYVADIAARFYSVNMDTGARTLLSDSTQPDGGANLFTNPMGLVLDEANGRALLSDYTTQQLLWVDLTTGARSVWVDSDQLNAPFDIKLDADDNRIVLTDDKLEAVMAVDLGSAALTTLSSASKPVSGANSLQTPWGIVIDEEDNIAFVGSNSQSWASNSAIIMVDLTTGERIVVSSSIQ